MTRVSDEQLELNFEDEHKPDDQALASSPTPASASIVCFTTHLRLRRTQETVVEDAKLFEQITSRVRHFK